VLLAAALAGDPCVIVADEPTSALDVGVREHVVAVLRARAARGAAVLLITHDLDVAAACDEVHVMYAGQLVESGPVDAVLSLPRHPYTRALVAAQPSRTPPGTPLPTLPGRAPVVGRWPRGCRFADRCPDVADVCAEPPALVVLADRSCVRCARIGDLR
jgi:oligopeptide/dipeptide ABC transporter ATP-binding protein